MSPVENPKPIQDRAVLAPSSSTDSLEEVPLQEVALQTRQPAIARGMDAQKPHDDDESNFGLRGGDRSRMCPGRFCFCIPCPLPCDFCII